MENKSLSYTDSNRSTKKKQDLQLSTIISSLERDINELLQETTIRSQKNKLISMSGKFLLTPRNPKITFQKIKC
jgi:hypothetical protein